MIKGQSCSHTMSSESLSSPPSVSTNGRCAPSQSTRSIASRRFARSCIDPSWRTRAANDSRYERSKAGGLAVRARSLFRDDIWGPEELQEDPREHARFRCENGVIEPTNDELLLLFAGRDLRKFGGKVKTTLDIELILLNDSAAASQGVITPLP